MKNYRNLGLGLCVEMWFLSKVEIPAKYPSLCNKPPFLNVRICVFAGFLLLVREFYVELGGPLYNVFVVNFKRLSVTLIEVNMRFIDVSPGDISSNRLLFTIEAGGHREKYK